MTAIGFTVAWIAAATAGFLYDPTRKVEYQSFAWLAACTVAGSGCGLVLLGIGIWLWKVMP